MVSGTRNNTVPSRSPNRRYGSVSQGRPASGDPPIARHDPPRCALTLNRNSGGVAASQAATFGSFGDW
jgi:hypothetical protein